MYILKVEYSFEAAHFLAGHAGKCRNIHGHGWKVVAEVESSTLVAEGESRGMVVDFSQLKKDLKQIVDIYDHALIVETDTLRKTTYDNLVEDGFRLIEVPFRTTAENFAKYFFDALSEKEYAVTRVSVFETPSNCAIYEGKRSIDEI